MARWVAPAVNCPRQACLSPRTRVRYKKQRGYEIQRHRVCLVCGHRWVTTQPPERYLRQDRQAPV